MKILVKVTNLNDNIINKLKQFMSITYISRISNVVIGSTNNINQIKQLPFVEAVSKEQEYKKQETYTAPEKPAEYLDQEGVFITNYQAEQYHNPINLTGRNIKIAILDTAVYEHKLIKNNIIKIINVTSDNNPTPGDHATWIAGTLVAKPKQTQFGLIKGTVPDAEIVSIQVLNANGVGTTSTIIKGLDKAIENNCQVANLSLAAPMKDKVLLAAVKEYSKHIIMSCAGGNFGNNSYIGCPADSPYTIAVGSVYPISNKKFKISNFSPKGVNIVAVGGNLNPPLYIISTTTQGYSGMAGTSMATPYITGFIAKLLQKHPTITPQEVLKLFNPTQHNKTQQPIKQHPQPSNPYYGIGLLNEKKLINYNISQLKSNQITTTHTNYSLPLLALLLFLITQA